MVNAVSIFGVMVALATISTASPLRDHRGKHRGFRHHRHRNGTLSVPSGTGGIILSTGVPVASEVLPVSTELAVPETILSPFTVTYTLGLGPSARAVTRVC